LTGATGFLGSHLLEALIKRGYKVSILKRSTSDTWRINHLLGKISAYNVDNGEVRDAFSHEIVDTVIHTACSYGRDRQTPSEIVEANLLFGLKVLDIASSSQTKNFINTDTLLPKYTNSYALSKKQFSEWLKQRSTEMQIVNLKLEHMYGPKDDDTKFVFWLISQIKQVQGRIALTEGNQLRDFIYIDDVVSAYLVVLKKLGQLPQYIDIDVGTGELTSVRNFVLSIYNKMKDLDPSTAAELGFGDIAFRESEALMLQVDNRALRNLGWSVANSQNKCIEKMLLEYK
jgi:CDP-paratose synthetase